MSLKFSFDALRQQTFIFWSNIWETHRTQTFVICRRFAKIINWASANTHSVSYLLHINTMILQDIIFYNMTVFFMDC